MFRHFALAGMIVSLSATAALADDRYILTNVLYLRGKPSGPSDRRTVLTATVEVIDSTNGTAQRCHISVGYFVPEAPTKVVVSSCLTDTATSYTDPLPPGNYSQIKPLYPLPAGDVAFGDYVMIDQSKKLFWYCGIALGGVPENRFCYSEKLL